MLYCPEPQRGGAVGIVGPDGKARSARSCDGAKLGCAMKAITAVDTAIRSALMALKGYGPTADDGLVELAVEQ